MSSEEVCFKLRVRVTIALAIVENLLFQKINFNAMLFQTAKCDIKCMLYASSPSSCLQHRGME